MKWYKYGFFFFESMSLALHDLQSVFKMNGKKCLQNYKNSHIDMVYAYVPPFGVLFREIWFSDQWVFITDEAVQMT